jgi:hypothetical protein
MKKMSLAIAICFAALISGCVNDASLGDGTSGGAGGSGGSSSSSGNPNGGGKCPNVGANCFSEGAHCSADNLTCHCGQWLEAADAHGSCENQNPNTCKAGMACGGEGASCSGFTCHCGMWMNPDLTGNVTCGSGGSSSSSSGSTGSGSPSGTPVHDLVLVVNSGEAYHLWCEGAQVDPYAVGADQNIHWLEAWHSFGCDSFDGSFSCPVSFGPNASLRFQCYLNTAGNETSGDNIRYVYADPSQMHNGENYAVTEDGSKTLTLGTQKFYLVTNLAPNGFSENAQIDP